MTDPDREAILERDQARKELRQALRSDVEQARHDLHPRTISTRWAARQKSRLADAGMSAKQNIAKNAPLIGIVAAAGLLFAARKPISSWIEHLRDRKHNKKGDE
ncbi:MAG: hypothetical protein IPM67_09530 [Sphingomonadales bacterium]|nr:hypothetical protein [Sphingomonadales bacterium]MBK9268863.1 hypothetical protein [Sphingomonadales bacterium]